jgi:hypothetical protein
MKPIRSFALLLGFVALTGCDKDAVQISSITAPATGARVKFFNFGINAPQVNFYANNSKVTAISSTTTTESTVGVAYGAVAAGGFYVALPPGATTFQGRIAATVDKDLPISTITGTLEDGKSYSVYQSGFYNTTTKQVEGFVVEDPVPAAFDYTAALVRFVNASPNSQPMQLSVQNSTDSLVTPIGAAIAYKTGGAFVAVPTGSYTLTLRTAGATTPAVTRTAVSFIAGRVYTITLRGDMTVSSTGTATNRPFLDNTLNR